MNSWFMISMAVDPTVSLQKVISPLPFFPSNMFYQICHCRVVIDNNACKDATVIEVLYCPVIIFFLFDQS